MERAIVGKGYDVTGSVSLNIQQVQEKEESDLYVDEKTNLNSELRNRLQAPSPC
jgi:hypothetical protein